MGRKLQLSKKSKKPLEAIATKLDKTLHTPLHELFTKLIRQARLNAGLTQVEASTQMGVRQSFISDIERGERRVDVIEFIRICETYGTSPGIIIEKLRRSSDR